MKLKFTYRPRIKNSVAQKTLSKLLAFGILVNSMPINSFASTLSEDGRYETFAGNNITVNNVLEEEKVDIKIEGNTLKNEANINSDFKIRNSSRYYEEFTICETSNLKLNTDYTLFIYKELLDNHNKSFNYLELGVGDWLNNTIAHPTIETDDNYEAKFSFKFKKSDSDETLKIKIKFTDFKDYKYLTIRPIRRYSDPVSNEYCNANVKILFLEGDYINYNIDYFEGLQSSFEDQLITQEMIDSGKEKPENLGKYKVEVKSTGKNEMNLIETIIDSSGVTDLNRVSYNIISKNEIITRKTAWYGDYATVHKLKPNTQYTISFDGNWGAVITVEGKTIVDSLLINTDDDTFLNRNVIVETGNNGLLRIVWKNRAVNRDSIFKNIQLEEGSVATEYEPYKESINTFYLNSPLLEGDTIEYINGQATHVKRSEEIILDGSRYIQSEKTAVENKFRWNLYSSPSIGNIADGRMVTLRSDKYKYISANETWFCSNEGLAQNNTGNSIYLYLEKYSDGSIDSKNLLISELRSNPVRVVYKLANPISKPIKSDLSVQIFEGTTHISNNSNIPVNIEITVDRTLNRAVEAIELAKINPTIENLSKARMWINLLDDSIKKDELQSEINNITNIEDLQLEKKSVTVNVDIYIKSENSLSMTLSTNSIMFDDYSGVSDIEKLNALEITVNSSLPYDLNAYLESEIQNNDKSTTIDSNLLQIKESSNLDYKTFNNTSDKVILEEDCPSGNYNKHNIDLKMEGSNAYKADVYKTVIKFEAEQK